LHNEILYSSPYNTNMMTLKEIRWRGHVGGMALVFSTNRIYVWKREGSIYRGKWGENWRIKLKQALQTEVKRCGPDQIAKSCECSNQTYGFT
jgi:hypothetical protein